MVWLTSALGWFKNIGNVIMIGIIVVLVGVIAIMNYRYLGAKATIAKQIKQKEALELKYSIVKQKNKNNIEAMTRLELEHKKDLELLDKTYKYNVYLEQRSQKLLNVINSMEDEPLSKSDRAFIGALYPQKEAK